MKKVKHHVYPAFLVHTQTLGNRQNAKTVLKTHSQRIKIVRPPARNVRKDELPLLEALNARRVLLENVSLMMEPASCVLLVIIQTRPTQCHVIYVI
jgi:hypothetical protein